MSSIIVELLFFILFKGKCLITKSLSLDVPNRFLLLMAAHLFVSSIRPYEVFLKIFLGLLYAIEWGVGGGNVGAKLKIKQKGREKKEIGRKEVSYHRA